MRQNKYKNATFSETLDNLIGEKGIKTDVAVKLDSGTVPLLIISVMAAVIGGVLIAGLIQKYVIK